MHRAWNKQDEMLFHLSPVRQKSLERVNCLSRPNWLIYETQRKRNCESSEYVKRVKSQIFIVLLMVRDWTHCWVSKMEGRKHKGLPWINVDWRHGYGTRESPCSQAEGGKDRRLSTDALGKVPRVKWLRRWSMCADIPGFKPGVLHPAPVHSRLIHLNRCLLITNIEIIPTI